MTDMQRMRVVLLVHDSAFEHGRDWFAHHGLCVGGDAEFHGIARTVGSVRIVGHPGPDWPDGPLCARVECDEVLDPMPHMKRNQAIVNASKIMIAVPYQDEPQDHGGTWRTIGMARKALRRGLLRDLYVVGRDGVLLDHARWP